MKTPENNQEIRAKELGFSPGIGKRYDAEALNAFYIASLPPFEQGLYQDGFLTMDSDYIDRIVKEFFPKKPKTKREMTMAENDLANLEFFAILAEPLAGTIPARWGDTQHILADLQAAKEKGIQFNADLIRFAIIHPSMQVRSTVWERQELSNAQMTVAAYMGIQLSNKEENKRAQSIGYASAAFGFPFAAFEEYGVDLFLPESVEA